jgi:PTS system nitrogen regulatory IIA component
MPRTDFDVERLAAYLHLTPDKVAKLAERAKIPGRKVAGQWRFARAEIHHWLEDRIGLSDEVELVEMEHVLQRSAPDDEQEEVCLADLIPLEAIAVPLLARTRNSVITTMVEVAARTGWLWEPDKMSEAVRSREEMHPTALENGVALMHPRRPMASILGQAFVALGVTCGGIPFGAGMPLSDVFFLICSVEDRGHLRVLARLSRLLTVPGFLDALRSVSNPIAARQMIIDTEQGL